MKTATSWLTENMPQRYADCIVSVTKQHPGHTVIVDWPDEIAEYRTGHDHDDSDHLRVWLLLHCYDLWIDADVTLDRPIPDIDCPGKIALANSGMTGIPDIWLMGGDKDVIQELWDYGVSVNFERHWWAKWIANNRHLVYLYNTSNIKHLALSISK